MHGENTGHRHPRQVSSPTALGLCGLITSEFGVGERQTVGGEWEKQVRGEKTAVENAGMRVGRKKE